MSRIITFALLLAATPVSANDRLRVCDSDSVHAIGELSLSYKNKSHDERVTAALFQHYVEAGECRERSDVAVDTSGIYVPFYAYQVGAVTVQYGWKLVEHKDQWMWVEHVNRHFTTSVSDSPL